MMYIPRQGLENEPAQYCGLVKVNTRLVEPPDRFQRSYKILGCRLSRRSAVLRTALEIYSLVRSTAVFVRDQAFEMLALLVGYDVVVR